MGGIVTCKCGARTYEGHLRRFRDGKTAAHTYRGHVWSPGMAS